MSLHTKTTKNAKRRISESKTNDSDHDHIWEVETIIDRKYDRLSRELRYLVKWKGWSIEQSTWEPIENLKGAHRLVEAFEKTYREIIRPLEKAYAAAGLPYKPFYSNIINHDESAKSRKEKEKNKKKSEPKRSLREKRPVTKEINSSPERIQQKNRITIRKIRRYSPESDDYKDEYHLSQSPRNETAIESEDQVESKVRCTPEPLVNNSHCKEEYVSVREYSSCSLMEEELNQEQNVLEHIESPKIFIQNFGFEEEADKRDYEDQAAVAIEQADCVSAPPEQPEVMVTEEKFDEEKSRIFSSNKDIKSRKIDKEIVIDRTGSDKLSKSDAVVQAESFNTRERNVETDINSSICVHIQNIQTNEKEPENLDSEQLLQPKDENNRYVLDFNPQPADQDLQLNQISDFSESNTNRHSSVEFPMPNQTIVQRNEVFYEQPNPMLQFQMIPNNVPIIQPNIIFNMTNNFVPMMTAIQPIQPVIACYAPVVFVNPVNPGVLFTNVIDNSNPFYFGANYGNALQILNVEPVILQQNSVLVNNTNGPNINMVNMSSQNQFGSTLCEQNSDVLSSSNHISDHFHPQNNLDTPNIKLMKNKSISQESSRWRQNSDRIDELKPIEKQEDLNVRYKEGGDLVKTTKDVVDPIILSNADKIGEAFEAETKNRVVKQKERRHKKSVKEIMRDNEKNKDDSKRAHKFFRNTVAYVKKDKQGPGSLKQNEKYVLKNKKFNEILEEENKMSEKKVLVIARQGSLRTKKSDAKKSEKLSLTGVKDKRREHVDSNTIADIKIEIKPKKAENEILARNNPFSNNLVKNSSIENKVVFQRTRHSHNYQEILDDLKRYDKNYFEDVVTSYVNGTSSRSDFLKQICPEGNFRDDAVKEIQKFSWYGAASTDPKEYLFKVSWRPKPDSTQRHDSIVSWEDLKQGAPKEAIKFAFTRLINIMSKYGTFNEL